MEKEWRESLQKELQKEKDRNVELQHDSRKLKTLEEVCVYVSKTIILQDFFHLRTVT